MGKKAWLKQVTPTPFIILLYHFLSFQTILSFVMSTNCFIHSLWSSKCLVSLFQALINSIQSQFPQPWCQLISFSSFIYLFCHSLLILPRWSNHLNVFFPKPKNDLLRSHLIPRFKIHQGHGCNIRTAQILPTDRWQQRFDVSSLPFWSSPGYPEFCTSDKVALNKNGEQNQAKQK